MQLSALNATVVRPVHAANACPAILSTNLGIVTDVRLLQPWNELPPMVVTELGMVTEVRLPHM